ncbi:ATP-grasp domain-containing protein [Streptomyces termitum]|uniref:ATP-grasp domain-containing protein n=1 Tax=Streptomyces termitum TaxID=67368 RepID=UPI0033B71BD9
MTARDDRAPGGPAHLVFVECNTSGSGFEALAAAKRLGHRVSFLTTGLAAYTDGAGEGLDPALLDRVVPCDTDDTDAVVAAVRALHREHPVHAVLTMSEWHVLVTAEAAHRLGLAGSGPEAVAAARDKSRTRRLCRAAGVPVPGFRRVERGEALDETALPLPCVVKPVDELLSIGVKLCHTAAEARAHVHHLLEERDQTYRGRARTPAVLVEEYLDGPEYSVETLTYEGTTRILAVTRKLLSPPPAFVETGHAVPAPLTDEVRAACEKVATDALAALGYTFGSAHVELRVTADGPRLIEVNCRPGGDRITRLVTLATGVELVAEQIGMHLGRPPVAAGRAAERGAAIVFLPSVPGRVDAITGTAAARAAEGVVDVGIYVAPGTETGSSGDNTDRFGHVIAVGPTSTVALARAEAAARTLALTVAAPAAALP